MRFRFCGDLDCPDWILAEISILSKMTSIKMKLFCQQVMNQLLDNEIDFVKVNKYTTDAKYELDDMKAAVAAVNFIISSAGKYGVDGETLSNELQQLGLPKELSVALCKVYTDKSEDLKEALRKKSLRLSKLKSIDWRVDFILSSSCNEEDINEPEIQLKLNTDVDDDAIIFAASSDKFRVLLHEMKQAYKYMEGL